MALPGFPVFRLSSLVGTLGGEDGSQVSVGTLMSFLKFWNQN